LIESFLKIQLRSDSHLSQAEEFIRARMAFPY
jgi:hypothetical protein